MKNIVKRGKNKHEKKIKEKEKEEEEEEEGRSKTHNWMPKGSHKWWGDVMPCNC